MAPFEQVEGTINELHGASVEKMRAEVEASCGDHGSQLEAQRAQLEKARDELHDGNAQTLHTAAIEELRCTIADKYDSILCLYSCLSVMGTRGRSVEKRRWMLTLCAVVAGWISRGRC